MITEQSSSMIPVTLWSRSITELALAPHASGGAGTGWHLVADVVAHQADALVDAGHSRVVNHLFMAIPQSACTLHRYCHDLYGGEVLN